MFYFYEVKSKSKGTFLTKHIYCKYTETKVILLFNVISIDFNAPVPEFHSFLNSTVLNKNDITFIQ
jgi:hypothetical protein